MGFVERDEFDELKTEMKILQESNDREHFNLSEQIRQFVVKMENQFSSLRNIPAFDTRLQSLEDEMDAKVSNLSKKFEGLDDKLDNIQISLAGLKVYVPFVENEIKRLGEIKEMERKPIFERLYSWGKMWIPVITAILVGVKVFISFSLNAGQVMLTKLKSDIESNTKSAISVEISKVEKKIALYHKEGKEVTK